jgi:hypothetical protein
MRTTLRIKVLYLLAQIALAIICFSSAAFGAAASLVCRLPGNIFVQGEYITAVVTLVNTGNKEYAFRYLNPESGFLSLIVEDSKGDTLPYHGVVIKVREPLPNQVFLENVIQRGESVSELYEITWEYSNFSDQGDPFSYGFQMFLRPDNYTLRAVWHNSFSFSHDTLRSNTVRFSVVSPPAHELPAYNAFKEMTNGVLKGVQTTQSVDSLKKFIRDFPNSAFAPYAKLALAGVYQNLSRFDEKNELVWEIISDYPESSYALHALMGSGLKGEDERQFMNKIWHAVPNTLAARYARDRELQLQRILLLDK